MESIFIGLCILFGVSSVAMAILFLLFRKPINNMTEATIAYDHIEEEVKKPKRKYTKYKKKNEKGPVAG